MAVQPLLYTVEEFEDYADSPENFKRLLELVDGEIVEKVPNEEHGLITGNIYGPLWIYVKQHKNGRVVVEVRYRSPHDDRNARIPDISFRSGNKPLVKKGSVPEMPDLAVEIKSPDESLREAREKVRFYLANGVKLVWLVLAIQRVVEVYSAADEQILTENDVLTGGDVLPGFTLPVREIFIDPAAEEDNE